MRPMMSIQARRELLQATVARYKAANRPGKGRILDELCASTGYHRKYATALLRHPPERKRHQKRMRKRIYTKDVECALVRVWEIESRPCSKRLVPFLPELVRVLENHGELSLTEQTRQLL